MDTTTDSRSNLDKLLDIAVSAADTTAHGYLFEHVAEYALRRSPEFAGRIVSVEQYRPWARRNRPQDKPILQRDNGVDLMVTLTDGTTIAVQCKGLARGGRSSYGELTNFIAQGRDLAKADQLLWITSGAGLNKDAAAHNAATGGRVSVMNYDWLASIGDHPDNFADLRAVFETKFADDYTGVYPLRPDQERAIVAALESFNTNHSVQVIMPCGTGKTITIYGLHVAMDSNLTLVVVPTLDLIAQSVKAFHRQSAGRFNAIIVCSDKTVLEKDEPRVTPEEIGKSVITDPAAVTHAIAVRDQSVKTVVFSTYQSIEILVEAQHDHHAPEFDLAVADEAHRLVSEKFGELFKNKTDGLRRLRAKKRLYTTATPTVLSPGSKRDSMSSGSPTFGPRAYQISFGQAIQLGILAPWKLSISVIDGTDADRMIADINRNRRVTDKVLGIGYGAQELSAITAIKLAMEAGEKLFVSYHSSVDKAEKFAKLAKQYGITVMDGSTPFAKSITGEMKSADRADILTAFGQRKVDGFTGLITNVRCLNEGIDIPSLDTVIFVDAKASETDIVQSVGRVLRVHVSKTGGHIIIPVPMSETDFLAGKSIEEVSEMMANDDRWKTTINTLKALAEHDNVFQAGINEAAIHGGDYDRITRHRSATKTGFERGDGIVDELKTGSVVFVTGAGEETPASAELSEKLHAAMRLVVISSVADEWMVRFGSLVKWVHVNRRFPASNASAKDERTLRTWVGTQRRAANAGTLSETRLGSLNTMLGDWNPNGGKVAKTWDENFDTLAEFVRSNKRFPGTADSSQDEKQIGNWLKKQRYNASNGILSGERLRKLDVLSDDWNPNETRARIVIRTWGGSLGEFIEFVRSNKRFPSSASIEPSENRVGSWLQVQRAKANKGTLSKERLSELNAQVDGWNPNEGKVTKTWGENLDALVEFVRSNDRFPRTSALEIEEIRIGMWLNTQRTNAGKGILSDVRLMSLNAALGVWNPNAGKVTKTWGENLDALVEFVRSNDRFPKMAAIDPRERTLGVWMGGQRTAANSGTILSERLVLLNAALEHWNPSEGKVRSAPRTWDGQLGRLAEFVGSNERQPAKYATDAEERSLGEWLSKQRTTTNNGTISDERLQKLRATLWDWNPNVRRVADTWGEKLTALFEFTQVHGRLPRARAVDADEKTIGMWVSTQKAAMNSGTISDERISAFRAAVNNCKSRDEALADVWEENLSKLTQFVMANNRWPRKKAHDDDERKSGAWLGAQRNAANRGTLTDLRFQEITAAVGDWNPRSGLDKTWDESLFSLVEFVKSNERRPSKKASSSDEKKLGEWLATQRSVAAKGTSAKGRIDQLNAAFPDWRGPRAK